MSWGKLILAFFGATIFGSHSWAGSWNLEPGKGQIISTNVRDTATQAYNDDWELTDDVQFAKLESQIFWEHGISKKITVVGVTSLQDVDSNSRDGQEQKSSGFGNSSLGLRYQLGRNEKSARAIQLSWIIAGSGENIPDADLGRGSHGIELRGLYGRNFKIGKRAAFLDIQSAWIYRPGNNPNSFKQDVNLGFQLFDDLQILAQAFYGKTNEEIIDTDIILPNENIKLQASVVQKRSEKRSIQIGYFETIAGRNIVKEKGVFAALWERY